MLYVRREFFIKILLSGGGNPPDVAPIDAYFARVIDSAKPVLYIPVAMEPASYSYDECFEWFTSTYRGYGITKVAMCTDLKNVTLDCRYTAVFIGGGNTFRLLSEMKSSNFTLQIVDFLKNDGILYGGSAGAIVCGQTIESALPADQNTVGLTDLSGLNLFNGFDIWCHYTAADDALLRHYPRTIYVLREDSGLVLEDDHLIGIGTPYFVKPTL